MMSSIEEMMPRSSRGAGTWQYSGKPLSYWGQSPCTTNAYGRAPHCGRPWARSPAEPAGRRTLSLQNNKRGFSLASGLPPDRGDRRSGLRDFAGRVERPVAVQADHAPLHAPAGADQSRILGNRIIEWALDAV